MVSRLKAFKPILLMNITAFLSFRIVTCALTLTVLASGLVTSTAQVLLTINASNPSAVVITATGNAPSASYNLNIANDGIDLLNFFSQDQSASNFGQFLTGSLTGGNIGVNYNDVNFDNESSPFASQD